MTNKALISEMEAFLKTAKDSAENARARGDASVAYTAGFVRDLLDNALAECATWHAMEDQE